MDWERFNDQFRESEAERNGRLAEIRRKRTAAGHCWQCVKPIALCTCPNINHPK